MLSNKMSLHKQKQLFQDSNSKMSYYQILTKIIRCKMHKQYLFSFCLIYLLFSERERKKWICLFFSHVGEDKTKESVGWAQHALPSAQLPFLMGSRSGRFTGQVFGLHWGLF